MRGPLSKIVQIQVVKAEFVPEPLLVVLCEDGSVWQYAFDSQRWALIFETPEGRY